MPKNDLNLLILDDEQLYAEKLSELINIPLVSTHLVLADEKEELLKMLRRPLDVIVHGNAFDITLLIRSLYSEITDLMFP